MRQSSQKFFFALMLLVMASHGQTEESLSKHLNAFEPFIGKTWRGEFTESTPEKPMIDVSTCERALNGQAVRLFHSINNGQYGGETIVMWDMEKESLVYFYFTTAGFYTEGTMTVEGNTIVGHEYVAGNQNGITEAKSTSTILPGGEMHVVSEYLQNGEWVKGHEVTYIEAPEAKVIFK